MVPTSSAWTARLHRVIGHKRTQCRVVRARPQMHQTVRIGLLTRETETAGAGRAWFTKHRERTAGSDGPGRVGHVTHRTNSIGMQPAVPVTQDATGRVMHITVSCAGGNQRPVTRAIPQLIHTINLHASTSSIKGRRGRYAINSGFGQVAPRVVRVRIAACSADQVAGAVIGVINTRRIREDLACSVMAVADVGAIDLGVTRPITSRVIGERL